MRNFRKRKTFPQAPDLQISQAAILSLWRFFFQLKFSTNGYRIKIDLLTDIA